MTNIYEALCLGGPMMGQFLSHTAPEYDIIISQPLITPNPQRRHAKYYFVPLLGLRGFWLFEDETKGNQPYDDIIRILCDTYVHHHKTKLKQ